MIRAEFIKRTKVIAWVRSQGRCEVCTAKISAGNVEYHHRLECTMGGDDSPENCMVVCRSCHRNITSDRAPVIAKSNRQRAKYIGIKKPRSIRAWRKFNGTPVFAPRER